MLGGRPRDEQVWDASHRVLDAVRPGVLDELPLNHLQRPLPGTQARPGLSPHTYARLRLAKAAHDPANVFRGGYPLELAGPHKTRARAPQAVARAPQAVGKQRPAQRQPPGRR